MAHIHGGQRGRCPEAYTSGISLFSYFLWHSITDLIPLKGSELQQACLPYVKLLKLTERWISTT